MLAVMGEKVPGRWVTIPLGIVVAVVVCALAGGWPGFLFGTVGALGGFWVTWTSEQYSRDADITTPS